MNYFTKKIKYANGKVDTIMIHSDDNYVVDFHKSYTLVGHNYNKINNRIKNSVLGMNIGFGNSGFASMTLIAAFVAVIAFVGMILSFRI